MARPKPNYDQRVRVWRRANRNGTVTAVLVATIGGALFPRLAYVLRWPRRAHVRGLLLYALWNAASIYVVRFKIAPMFREEAHRWEQTRSALATELGREPTKDEVVSRFSGLADEC